MSKTRFWTTFALALLLGLVGFILGSIFPLPSPYGPTKTKILLTLFGVFIGLLTSAQIVSWVVKTTSRLVRLAISNIASEIFSQIAHLSLRGNEPPAEGGKALKDSIILDTSSIIDGRVLDVAKNGFLCGIILVPAFVLTELQQVADSADPIKRARGRRGFEIIDQLKKIHGLKVKIWDQENERARLADIKEVDEKLIRLAKFLKAKILTCDFNLNRVAKTLSVPVLNINELSNSLKTLPVPGEILVVKVVQQGKDSDQGVGYLSDGTMVVIRGAGKMIGRELSTEVTKILQGQAGRMIFAKLA